MNHHKNQAKRTLAVLLSVLMLMSAWVFVAPTAFAGLTVSGSLPTFTFYVPETIYLNPANNANFQYYVDREQAVNGALRTGSNTTGNIYFNCPGATAVTGLSCDGATVNLSATTSGNGTLSSTINSGSLSSAISMNSTTQISWTVTFTYNGESYIATAYSQCYAPNRNVTADGSYGRSWRDAGVVYASGLVWLQGAQVTGTATHNNGDNCESYRMDRYQNISGDRKLDPLVNGVNNASDNAPEIFGSTSSTFTGATKSLTTCRCLSGVSNGKYANNDQWILHCDYNATSAEITVDKSRYSNLNQLPNLKLGFMVTDWDSATTRKNWYVSDISSLVTVKNSIPTLESDSSETYGVVNLLLHWYGQKDDIAWSAYTKCGTLLSHSGGKTSPDMGSTAGASEGTTVKYQQPINYNVSSLGNGTTTTRYFKGMTTGCNGNSGSYSVTSCAVSLKVTAVDKTNLRTLVNSCVGQYMDGYYTDIWALYENRLKQACEALGNPKATPTEVEYAEYNLNAAKDALVRATGTATVTHQSATGAALGTDSEPYNYGETVTAAANSYNGYTYTSASPSTLSYKNVKDSSKSWTMTYTPIWYTISYDTNGAPSINDEHYHIESTSTVATPTRTGYSFDNWTVTSATQGSWTKNATIGGGTSLTGKYGNALLKANWTVNSSTLIIDPKDGRWQGYISPVGFQRGYGDTYTPSDPTPPTGKHFTGWTLTRSTGGQANGSFANGVYTFGPDDGVTDVLTANYADHDYGSATYVFAPDGSSCSASHTCQTASCGYVENESANITSTQTKDETCLVNGETTYTATFTKAGFSTQTLTVADVPSLGHDWSSVSYTWNDDNSECTASRSCQRDDCDAVETETVSSASEQTKDETCTEKGETTYTAEFENTAFETQTNVVADVPSLGHEWDYENATYVWDGYSSCAATVPCSRHASCGYSFPAITSSSVSVSTSVPATCLVEGEELYTAVFNGRPQLSATKTKNIGYGAHELGEQIAAQAGEDCQHTGTVAYYHCSVCGKDFADANAQNELTSLDNNTPGAHDFSVLQYNETSHWYKCSKCDATNGTEAHSGGSATCKEKAKCNVCDQEYGSYAAHTLTPVDAVAGIDCQHTGTVSYYHCSVCGQNFADANAQTLLTSLDDNTPGAHDFSVLQYNETNHWYKCSKCDATNGTEAHSGGSATCIAKAKCGVCDQEYGDYGAHALGEEIAAQEGIDCQHTGTVAYYHCSVCEKDFADANAQNELLSLDDNTPGAHDFSVLQYNENNHWYKCSKCDATDGNEAHSGGSATCIAKAKCDVCDQEYGNYGAHALTPVDAVAGIDCQHNGTIAHFECTVCHKTFSDAAATDEITELSSNTPGAHDFSVLQYNETNHWYKCSLCDATDGNEAHSGGTATCQNKAKCTVCDQEYGDFGAHATEAVDAAAGIDCQHTGTIAHFECTVCRKTFSDAEATNEITELSDGVPGSHSFTVYNSNNDATCMADGTKTAHCDYDCGTDDTVPDEGSKIPHKFTVYNSNNDATCTADGTKTAYCDYDCGTDDTVPDEGSMLPHSYTVRVTDDEYHWMKCATCDAITGKEAHTGTATCIARAVCEVCEVPFGEVDLTNHATTETVLEDAKDPGYTFKGYTGDLHCAACGEIVETGSEIDMLSLEGNATLAAADEILAMADKYSVSDITTLNGLLDTLEAALAVENNDDAVLAAMQALAQAVATIEPTGPFYVTFIVNGQIVSEKIVSAGADVTPPSAPELVNNGDTHKRFTGWSEDLTNVMSDMIVTAVYTEEDHVWLDGTVIKAANCAETGLQHATCACGAIGTKVIPIDPDYHTRRTTTIRENEVPATCTAEGSYEEVVLCECGVEISREQKTIAMLPHTPGRTEYEDIAEATCTEGTGYYTVVYCSVCGQEASRTKFDSGEALGHNWGDWTVTKEATCTAEGSKTHTCARCGETETAVIEKTAHPDADGNTTCDVCGYVFPNHTHKDDNHDNICDGCGAVIDTGFRCSFCNRNDEAQASSNISLYKTIYSIIHFFIHTFEAFRI